MGQMEEKSRKKKKKADLRKIILASVALAGGLAVAAIAPNVLGAMAKLGMLPAKREKEIIKRSRKRLIDSGLLVYRDHVLQLTQKGERALRFLELTEFSLKKPKRWDGRWRVLIFDIPETRRRVRARVREVLSKIGFTRLQDSVWLYPYDCEDAVVLLKADLKVGKDILYLIVDELEYAEPHLRHFGLK
jgi:CRISPR-associated endonuclease Cas2